MGFTLIDLTGGGQIRIGEAQEENSFTREEGPEPQITVRFNIFGAENASEAYLALLSWLHSNYSDGFGGIACYDLPLLTVRLSTRASLWAYVAECVFKYDAEDNTNSEINESSYNMPTVEDADYSFDSGGGSAHITHARATLYAARPDGGAPVDYGGLIGPRDDGGADGVDIITPGMDFTITLSLPKYWFTAAYRMTIASAKGSVNSVPWGGYGAGNVLFKGVSARVVWMTWTDNDGNTCKDWYWRAQFNFSAAPGVPLTVGGQTIYKRGWDVVSRISENYSDAAGNTCAMVAQVNVYAVYPEFNFWLLNLPMPE